MVLWLPFLCLNKSRWRTCLRLSNFFVTFDLPIFAVHQLYSTLGYLTFCCFWLGYLLFSYIRPRVIRSYVAFTILLFADQLFYLGLHSVILPYSYLLSSYSTFGNLPFSFCRLVILHSCSRPLGEHRLSTHRSETCRSQGQLSSSSCSTHRSGACRSRGQLSSWITDKQ
jgi:hypothetical protein